MLFDFSIGRWSLLVAISVLVTRWYSRWRKCPAAPGPQLARFTNIWQAYRMIRGDFEKQNVELHRKHGKPSCFSNDRSPRVLLPLRTTNGPSLIDAGKIVRLGPNDYSVNDVDAAKIIYGHGTRFTKSEWYRVWQVPKDFLEVNLFAQQNIKQHADARRRYASLYSMSAMVEYEEHVENCIEIFNKICTSCSGKGETVDLTKLFQFYAFDVIGEITVSVAPTRVK